MNELVRNDIIAVFDQLLEIFKTRDEKDVLHVKELSNQVMHSASVFQDEASISIAVLTYSIAKIMERKLDLDYSKLGSLVASANIALKIKNQMLFDKSIQKIFDFIREIDQKLGLYFYEVTKQAQIKKGCKLCEHGISVARASEILGISQWELMHYMGKTTLTDKLIEPSNVLRRLDYARSLFK